MEDFNQEKTTEEYLNYCENFKFLRDEAFALAREKGQEKYFAERYNAFADLIVDAFQDEGITECVAGQVIKNGDLNKQLVNAGKIKKVDYPGEYSVKTFLEGLVEELRQTE